MSQDDARQTPLLDLLRAVPRDAVGTYRHTPTHHQHIPYGRLCHEAAAEIERMRAEIEAHDAQPIEKADPGLLLRGKRT